MDVTIIFPQWRGLQITRAVPGADLSCSSPMRRRARYPARFVTSAVALSIAAQGGAVRKLVAASMGVGDEAAAV